MRPPPDVPEAPSRASTHSTTMPCLTMASVKECIIEHPGQMSRLKYL
jgi:hypothetical protein